MISPPSMTADPLELEELIQLADSARKSGALDEAVEGYKRALMVCTEDDVLERASIYANVGDVKRTQGKGREAELNFEKALGLMPGYKPALVALVDLAEAEKDYRRAIVQRKRLLAMMDNDDARVSELRRVAALQRDQLSDTQFAPSVAVSGTK